MENKEQEYRHILENIPGVIWELDLDLNTTYISPSVKNLFAEPVEAYMKKTLEEKFPPRSLSLLHSLFTKEIKNAKDKNRSRIVEIEHYRSDGTLIWISVHISFRWDEKGNHIGFLCVLHDITEHKKKENELLFLSSHDHLTSLYNRKFFEENLKKLDTEETLPLSIIICDINGLKLINDSFGHDSGDKVLIKTAEAIKKACREEDIIARIGGDEFAIILPIISVEETAQIAKRIKELVSKEKVFNVEVSLSFGYYTKTTVEQKNSEIFANAENCMCRHKLYERSSIRSKTIEIIMKTLFEKSQRESQHSRRVGFICQAIAEKINYKKDNVNQLRIAGLMHDIGKIGISEGILNKHGRLTNDEKKEMEKHPEIGWRILNCSHEFLELAQFVLHHHEKWDGSGYPNGLKGEEIPLESRIITIADAYDAMTAKRSYKDKMAKEDAINELKRCAGTHFDPEIVEVFVNQVLPYYGNLEGGGGNTL